MFKCRDAIKDHAVKPGVVLERIEPVIQAFRFAQHAILADGHVPFLQLVGIANGRCL